MYKHQTAAADELVWGHFCETYNWILLFDNWTYAYAYMQLQNIYNSDSLAGGSFVILAQLSCTLCQKNPAFYRGGKIY